MRSVGVAIVGASRFLGTHLVRGFEARGARVVPVVGAAEPWSPAGAVGLDEAERDPARLGACEGVVLVLTAGDLVERAAQMAAAVGARRLTVVSSVGVHGFPARLPVTEEHPYAPRTAAAAALVEAEVRARRSARELGLELAVVRPAIVLGAGDPHGLLDEMAARMRAGTYVLVGAGDNVLHHIHVDDAVEGIWLAATRDEAAGDRFLLAGPETTTLAHLSENVARAIGRPPPARRLPPALARALATVVDVAAQRGLALGSRPSLLDHTWLDEATLPVCYDIGHARRRLGFEPRVGYEECVARTLRGDWPAVARAGAGP